VSDVSDLMIRPVDPRDTDDMDAFQEVYAAAERSEDPEVGLYSREDAIAMLTSGTGEVFDGFGGFLGGRMVGESILIGSTRANLEVAQVLLWVHPDHRRRGYGTHLLASIEQHARARDRRILRVQARVGDGLEGNQQFAEHHGWSLVMTEVERRLRLPVDLTLVERLAAQAAPYHEGYEIRAVLGPVPVELRPSYVDLRNLLLVEMPHGDLEVEAAGGTVADLDTLDREREKAGRTAVSAIALRDGLVVAYAEASVPGGDARHVDQYGTLVHPDHRGHRLGMAVKCAQMRLLAERFPGRAYVQTTNAEVNARMVAINVALGFEVHQVWGEFEKRMPPPDPSAGH
jgi:GNAT superfamily N-acetyltransferase